MNNTNTANKTDEIKPSLYSPFAGMTGDEASVFFAKTMSDAIDAVFAKKQAEDSLINRLVSRVVPKQPEPLPPGFLRDELGELPAGYIASDYDLHWILNRSARPGNTARMQWVESLKKAVGR